MEKDERLVCDFLCELRAALKSLRRISPYPDEYLFFLAHRITEIAEGYAYLRGFKDGIAASKLLVRPAIEAMYRLWAVQKDPSLLPGLYYSDHSERMLWIRENKASLANVEQLHAEAEAQWAKFKEAYGRAHPEHPIIEKKISAYDAAEKCGIPGHYHLAYRLYCQHLHAHLSSLRGFVPDAMDSPTIALALSVALVGLSGIGAATPNIETLQRRLRALRGCDLGESTD